MINVVVGLFGLGLVVFVHELGHLLVAKKMGIAVEAFSVGWGRKIWSVTRGGTEYRISWLPIGGYCKMQGEHALLKAWQEKSSSITVEKGDFYAARPWQRILVLLAGPAVNFFFAVVVLGIIAMIGYSFFTFPNKIILADDYHPDRQGPAAQAGLQTGDLIVQIDSQRVESFRDIQSLVSRSAQQDLSLKYQREDQEFSTTLVPALNPSTGAGYIGIYPWIEPVISQVIPGSPADMAGLRPGDRILAVEGQEIPHSIALEALLQTRASAPVTAEISRDGEIISLRIVPGHTDEGTPSLGIGYKAMEVSSGTIGPLGGLKTGFDQSLEILHLTLRSISLLFSGIDLNQALMGPARITYMVGEVAAEGFRAGLGAGLFSFFNFLSLISITLFFMNLLPIPALDGGQILLTGVEIITRKPLHPRLVYHYQVAGNIIIVGLMFFAVFNDILFFARS
ncbi:regulator of sigma E protease [Alkalispirochaeta americana]|uniref:Zinc metalloprotease n=1 Tax=Alkalispirochaeta americana TaxID=159291 RepID=A0A1N6PSN5_9SPIO|nr:RIP metalloprotease RseP [Alkalispirochaeta americana]SIQ07360.1 regulator of sigma E protease [Alkalispirochaeta americana]